MLLRAARKKTSEKTYLSCRGWWNMRGAFLSRCQKGSRLLDANERLEGYTRVCAIRREGAGETNILRTAEQNPRYKFGVWLGVRSNSAECFVGTAEGVLRAREVRRIEQQDR